MAEGSTPQDQELDEISDRLAKVFLNEMDEDDNYV